MLHMIQVGANSRMAYVTVASRYPTVYRYDASEYLSSSRNMKYNIDINNL